MPLHINGHIAPNLCNYLPGLPARVQANENDEKMMMMMMMMMMKLVKLLVPRRLKYSVSYESFKRKVNCNWSNQLIMVNHSMV